jgi:hypothetical protein
MVILAGAGALFRWAMGSASPARTLALAASVLRTPVALDSALTVNWTWSVGGTTALEERWLALVAPDLPPGLCLPPGTGAASPDLDAALRQLHEAVRRRAGRDELERRLLAVRAAGSGAPGSRQDFLVRYGLARGYAAAADWATAADLLEPLLEGRVSQDAVPEVTRSGAAALAAGGRVGEALAVDAFHGRYLAGTVAYHRGEADLAVTWFRRAINAVNYLLAFQGGEAVTAEGHYQRVIAATGEARCPGDRADEALTSLDAYAGLVAAYMADEDFRDPPGLPREVARTRLQIDPGDPFRPVLDHAGRTRGDPGLTPIPENLLWAASNLQRVYHYNRLRPDPRLEVTRAVLLLHVTRQEPWLRALEAEGGADVCVMLLGIGQDLQRDAAALQLAGGRALTATDSARAAVAVQTFARLGTGCAGDDLPVVEPQVRSAWIQLGGRYLTQGLGGMYEGIRSEVEAILHAGSAPPLVLEERLTPPIERARGHLRQLRRGRVPGEMPADLPPEPARRFVEEWWQALFVDVAEALVARVRGSDAAGEAIRAGEVPELLEALESAVDHAGLRPRDVYAAGELAPLAATQGSWAALSWRLRTALRNQPVAAVIGLGLVALALVAGAVLCHVAVWRYRLLTRDRFYRAELGRVA